MQMSNVMIPLLSINGALKEQNVVFFERHFILWNVDLQYLSKIKLFGTRKKVTYYVVNIIHIMVISFQNYIGYTIVVLNLNDINQGEFHDNWYIWKHLLSMSLLFLFNVAVLQPQVIVYLVNCICTIWIQ